ncbi:diguanylate cyclase domain-containing protein [Piscinibacter sp.]|uniref:diguanylate cyclase domain-containing protein n=1 Tax=Piscinibacter sp. TaxID=1903157 RepID=UPI0039E25718
MPDPARDDPAQSTIERLVNVAALPIARWDADARLLFCNPTYQHWAARPRDELIGRTLAELFGDDAWERARPAFERAFRGATTSYERLMHHGVQAGRWARIQVFPDADADGAVHSVLTLSTDIHEDVTAREALVAARVRLDRFTENIPYPLTYVDEGFVLRFVNKAYCEIAGQSADQLVGRHIGAARGARRWAEHEPHFRRALEGKTVHYTRLVGGMANSPGAPRWLRTSYVPDFDADGRVAGLYTVTIDVHEMTVAQEQLRRSVERDTLTDVYSRRTMMDRIDAAMVTAQHEPVALFFVDLDGFKAVNDRLGHREGDALLVRVAQALQASVRADDAVGRFGGDEFLVLASVRSPAGARALALHMLEAVREVSAGVSGGGVSASIGYALAPLDAQHPLKLLQAADDAMYAAKRLGKDRAHHGPAHGDGTVSPAAAPPA